MSELPPGGRTLPQLLLKSRDRWGARGIALRSKEYGIWREYRWDECCERTKAIHLGLKGLGMERGTTVCILGRSSPEWFFSELAVQAAGGVPVGVVEGLPVKDTERLAIAAGVELALAEGQEQVDRLLGIRARLPQLKRVVYWRAKGVERYADPCLLTLEELMRAGGDYGAAHPRDFEASVAGGRGDDVAIRLMALKGDRVRSVPVTHEFLVSYAEAASDGGLCRGRKRPEYVAGSDPCWFFEQALGYAMSLTAGQVLNFPEGKDAMSRDFREISPQVVVRRPRAWDAMAAAINGNVAGSTRLKRAVCRYGLSAGYQVAGLPAAGGPAGAARRLLGRGADLAVFGPLRDKHGLNRARSTYVAGGAASEETRRLFRAINIHLREIHCSARDGFMTADPGEELGLD